MLSPSSELLANWNLYAFAGCTVTWAEKDIFQTNWQGLQKLCRPNAIVGKPVFFF